MTTTVWARFDFVGFHNWPEAPEGRAYLRERHRHRFFVEVEVEVSGDRQIEFHDLLQAVRVGQPEVELYSRSCEEIAAGLGRFLAETYQRPYTVTVSEDGECGARVRG